MISQKSKYGQLGIDAQKQKVKNIFGKYVENQFPGAFVNIIHDPIHSKYVLTQHMDGDGSKFVERLLVFQETKDRGIIRGAVDDALQMNLGDIAASGFVFGPIIVTDVININSQTVPKEIVMREIGQRFKELLGIYKKNGFEIHFLGGETADLPTQVKNITFDVAVTSFAKESEIIKGNVKPGDKIYGFASDGKASWEKDTYNSGIMSNGLTLARIMTMSKHYTKLYPHLGIYKGKYKIGEKTKSKDKLSVSSLLTSPTRQWAILIKRILEKLKKNNMSDYIHGISMNTGGGVTKICNLGKNIVYRKKMPIPPEIFQIIKKESNEKWSNMYETFNCGVGIDIVGRDDPRLKQILEEVSKQTHVKLFELGKCEKSKDLKNHVIAETKYGTFRL